MFMLEADKRIVDRNFVSPKRAKHFAHPTREIRIIDICSEVDQNPALKSRLLEVAPEEVTQQRQDTDEVTPVPGVDYLAFDSNEAKVVFEAPHQNGKVSASAARELQEVLVK